jgi:hypothetical protein
MGSKASERRYFGSTSNEIILKAPSGRYFNRECRPDGAFRENNAYPIYQNTASLRLLNLLLCTILKPIYIPQRNDGACTGASQKLRISLSTFTKVKENPCISSDVMYEPIKFLTIFMSLLLQISMSLL